MKNLYFATAAALALYAGAAQADSLDNTGGLDWTIQRASVSCDGANPASAMIRRGAIFHIVDASAAEACADLIATGKVFALTDPTASSKDLADVEAFMAENFAQVEYTVQLRERGGDPIFEKDANGDLVLDGNGDPILIGRTNTREFF